MTIQRDQDGEGPLVIKRQVKWGECDPAGVVYTPRFGDYVVEAGLAFLEQLFGAPTYERLGPLDLALPAKAIRIEFKHSLWPDQTLDITVQVAEVRTRTFDLDVKGALVDGTEVFDSVLSMICIHKALREARPLPQSVRDQLIQHRERCQRRSEPAPESATIGNAQ